MTNPPSQHNWAEWALQHVTLISELSQKCNLKDLVPAPDLSYNYILLGKQNELPIVLKLSSDRSTIEKEARALLAFQGHGTVKLLEEDSAHGALLLQRLTPGTSLKSFFPDRDDQAIHIACQVMETLHQAPLPENHTFPHVKEWLEILDQSWDIPESLLTQGRTWRDELLSTQGPPILLHGDLHHDNILNHGTKWIAIDPKGVIGERAYEVCAFLRNPLPTILNHPHLNDLTAARIDLFSTQLNIDPKRLWMWHFVQCILAACWMLEDQCDPSPFITLAIDCLRSDL